VSVYAQCELGYAQTWYTVEGQTVAVGIAVANDKRTRAKTYTWRCPTAPSATRFMPVPPHTNRPRAWPRQSLYASRSSKAAPT